MKSTGVSAPAPNADVLRMEAEQAEQDRQQQQQLTLNHQPTSLPPTYADASNTNNEKSAPVGTTADNNYPQSQPQTTLVTPLTALGHTEAAVDCPRCRCAVRTRIERHAGERATIWSVVICLCVGCLCAWIPCVMDDCKDTEHYCSTCNLPLATTKAGGEVVLSGAVRSAASTGSQFNPGQPQQQQKGGVEAAPQKTQSQFAPPAGVQQPQQYRSEGQMQETGTV